jgi:hypothetical protein
VAAQMVQVTCSRKISAVILVTTLRTPAAATWERMKGRRIDATEQARILPSCIESVPGSLIELLTHAVNSDENFGSIGELLLPTIDFCINNVTI